MSPITMCKDFFPTTQLRTKASNFFQIPLLKEGSLGDTLESRKEADMAFSENNILAAGTKCTRSQLKFS